MARFGPPDADRLRATAQALVEEHRLPGLGVGVVSGGELAFAEGFGHADIETARPQDPALRQRIGSITKTMTALCVMALVDEGRLSLDDSVVRLLPDVTFHGPAGALTVRHLLSHTGGIGEAPNPADLPRFDAFLFSSERDTRRVPASFPDGITIETAPGSKWAYANHGYALLGELIMRLEDAPLKEVLERRIFEPLGMANTDCLDQPHPDLTTGYHRAPSPDEVAMRRRAGLEVPEEEPVDGLNIRGEPYLYLVGHSRRASGAVQSTVHDMARYASALLRKSRGIVRPETFDLMVTPHWQPDRRLAGIGLSFFLQRVFGRRSISHGGGVAGGWNTFLDVYPDEDVAVLTHLNLGYDRFDEITRDVARAALGASDPELPELPLDRPAHQLPYRHRLGPPPDRAGGGRAGVARPARPLEGRRPPASRRRGRPRVLRARARRQAPGRDRARPRRRRPGDGSARDL
jgi:CubicO group peptidase (beta-lactamase class C family)